ncbi:MAG TPA: threo-3-hydroxy-L-aspartate ammonia-lyase [Vicinamibacterales bacterium]
MMRTNTLPTYDDVETAAGRLAGVAHKTPVITSRTVDARTGARVFFKCENLQRMGAFKFRGAYNALSQLSPEARRQGVLTFSSGNHAQAIALSGQLLGIPTTIIMPSDAPAVKLEATRGYGGEVVLYERATSHREELGQRLAAERGLTLIPPYDHPDIIAGQGTAVRELLQETGPLDLVLTPCGGGGLLSGSALAASGLAPTCGVIGVEPAAGDDGTRSFRSGTLQRVENPDTIADGARTNTLGQLTFPLIQQHVRDMLTVTDDQLLQTMFFLWERLKVVIEPTGALAAAAVLHTLVDVRGARVGVVISGGNVDLDQVGEWRRRVAAS